MESLIKTWSTKATAKRGLVRMGIPPNIADKMLVGTDDIDGRVSVTQKAIDRALKELDGLAEEDENLKLSTGHVNCPHCGIHLSNGVCDFDSTADAKGSEKEAYKVQQHEWMCLGCNGQWGPERIPSRSTRKASSKAGPSGDERARSTVERPVKIVWDLADANPGAKRKEIVDAAVAKGVTINTAKTQFQYWRKARGLVGKK